MAADDQQFCLRWNNHQSTLISVFDTLLENGTLVDCTLAAEGQYLKAHKVVLSACSPYLEILLSQHNEKHPIVILKDVTFNELKAMMDYMYRGEVNISQDQLGTFLKSAESLQIKGLTDNGTESGDSRDVGSTAPKRQDPPPRKIPPATPPIAQPSLPLSSGLSIEQRRTSSQISTDSPRDGSISPSLRKRRRTRRPSGDDSNLTANDTSNSCDLPSQAQSTPLASNVPSTPVTMPTPIVPPTVNPKSEFNRLDASNFNSVPPESGLLKEKIEPPSEPLLEPKTEYLDYLNNDNSVEDLTLDDDDDMDMSQPGPSHGGDPSQQGYSQWHMSGDQTGTADEVFMAAQEAVNAQQRDSQDSEFIEAAQKVQTHKAGNDTVSSESAEADGQQQTGGGKKIVKIFSKDSRKQSKQIEEIVVEPLISTYSQNGTKNGNSDNDMEYDNESLDYPASDASFEPALEEQNNIMNVKNTVVKSAFYKSQLLDEDIGVEEPAAQDIYGTQNKKIELQSNEIKHRKLLSREDESVAVGNIQQRDALSMTMENSSLNTNDECDFVSAKESLHGNEQTVQPILGKNSNVQDEFLFSKATVSNTKTHSLTSEEADLKPLVHRMRKKYRTAKRYPTYKIKHKKKKTVEKGISEDVLLTRSSPLETFKSENLPLIPEKPGVVTKKKRKTKKVKKKKMIEESSSFQNSSTADTSTTEDISKQAETSSLFSSKIEGYCCSNCGLVYRYKATLKRHQIYECGKDPKFFCYLCDYKGKHKGSLKKHIENKHVPKTHKPRKRGRPKKKTLNQTEETQNRDEIQNIDEVENDEESDDGIALSSYKKNKGLRLVRKFKEKHTIKEIERAPYKRKIVKKEYDPDYVHY